MNDSDYLAVFHQLIMPLAIKFNPDAVIVSAGFDCALGDPEVRMPAPNVHVICENKIAPKMLSDQCQPLYLCVNTM